MTKLFSLATMGFYAENLRPSYVAAGSWPIDAIEVDADTEAQLRAAIGAGSAITPDGIGGFTFAPAPAPPFGPIAAAYLDTVRAVREQILNRLAGIGMAALLASDSTTAQAAGTARQALLDITKAPAVLAATDLHGIKAAVLSVYRAIVAAAPAELVKAFDAEGL